MTLVSNPRLLTVLRLIREHQTVTRAEIGHATGLSVSQVSRITSHLRRRGLITVDGRVGGAEGRPTDVLALARHGCYVVGLDIGGLMQVAVVTNLRGEVVASVTTQVMLTRTRKEMLAHIVQLVNDSLAKASVGPTQVLGLGVGLRAVVDPVAGMITGGPETPGWTPAWIDFPIRNELGKVFPWSLILVDDTVRALGVAERRYGHGYGEQDFIYLLSDTGIGAAIMIGGRPYIGSSRLAGEIGHITMVPDGELCGCGRIGCLETLASSSALVKKGRNHLGSDTLTIETLIAAADRGDGQARQLLVDGGEALGRGLAVLLNLLSPSLVVIGGSTTDSSAYFEAAGRVARGQALGLVGKGLRILRSKLGPLAGATGAATMILDAEFDAGEGLLGARRVRPFRSMVAATVGERQDPDGT